VKVTNQKGHENSKGTSVTYCNSTASLLAYNYLLPFAKGFTKFNIRTVVKTVVRHTQRAS